MWKRSIGGSAAEVEEVRSKILSMSERESWKTREPESFAVRAKAAALMKETDRGVSLVGPEVGVSIIGSEGLDGGGFSLGGCTEVECPEVDVGAEGFCRRFRKQSIQPPDQSINGLKQRSQLYQKTSAAEESSGVTRKVKTKVSSVG